MPTERYQAYHEAKAKGGIGLTMVGGSSNVSPDSGSVFGQLDLGTDEVVPHLEAMARRVHKHGAAAGNAAETGVEITAEERDGEVVVRVLDHGPGFDNTDPERLFELFYRAEAARSVPGGAGIGLFVCRNLIEAMGGRMWAKQRTGGGAEFGFSLNVLESDLAG